MTIAILFTLGSIAMQFISLGTFIIGRVAARTERQGEKALTDALILWYFGFLLFICAVLTSPAFGKWLITTSLLF